MRVIVCGAGQVGHNIARFLSRDKNDVVVVDQRPDLIRRVGDTLDVKAIIGHGSHPDVLERAGASDADMLIAVTASDEVNMVACQVAHSLFNVPTKIARIRHQSYLSPHWRDLFSRDHLPIDVIISPEAAVAQSILGRLELPGVVEVFGSADGLLRVIGVRCEENCPILHTPLRQLTEIFPDLRITVIGLIRHDRFTIPVSTDQFDAGDVAYFTVASDHIDRALAAFGHEERRARRVVLIGGGNVGLYLAREIEDKLPDVHPKLIEISAERANLIADQLSRTVVINGDALDQGILDEASVQTSEAVIAVSNDDEVNVIAALLAKRSGANKVMALINSASYHAIVTSLGVDIVINPREVTVSSILRHIRKGRVRGVHSLHDGAAEVLEVEALETTPIVGTPLREFDLPQGVIIGAVVRDGKVVIPRGDTVIRPMDRVTLLCLADRVHQVEQLFTVRPEFF